MTQEYLKSIINYNPDTGMFTWAVDRALNVLKGSNVYVSKDKHMIKTSGKKYRAEHLAWLYVYGVWPKAIYHINGDTSDLRISNLTDKKVREHIDYTIEEVAELIKYDPELGVFHTKEGALLKQCQNTYDFYCTINFKGNAYSAHRLAWVCYYGEVPNIIDHIDGNPTNNKISNLRNGDQRQNSRNKRMHREGRLVGAIKTGKPGRWQAVAYLNKIKHHLGYFNTELAAHEAYKTFCIENNIW